MANENTFDNTSLRSPRYSGRRALNFLGRGVGDPVIAPNDGTAAAPPIAAFTAPPVAALPGGGAGGGEAPPGIAVDTQDPAPVFSIDPNTGQPPAPPPGSVAGTDADPEGPGPSNATGNPGGPPGADTGSVAGTAADAEGPGPSDATGNPGAAPGAADAGADAGAGAGGDAGGSACFITEAVMAAGGQNDQAPELEALRQFRDQAMMSNPVGQAMVAEYEAIAPIVVEAISQRPDAMSIFGAIKGQFLDRAVMAIQQGDMNEAFKAYAEMMAFVTPFAIEAQIGAGGDPDDRVQPGQEQIDDFGDMAAMGAYNPEMAGAATGGMEMDDPMMDAGMPQVPGGAPGGAMPPPEPAIGQFVRRY